ncbi:MAG TPA: amidohydrolase family protein [Polyangiaceae bacterium]
MRSSPLLIALVVACGGASNDATTHVAPTATASVAPPVAAKPVVTKRVVVSLTRKSGTNVTTVAPDGTITVALDVLQNGRGPHTDASITLGPDGTIASLVATGHHEMRTPVDERFTRTGDTATWKSREEDGHATVSGSAFFLPVCDLPDAIGWLAQALLRAGGSMKLLPSGEAKIERTAETEVTSASGEKRKVVGYAITGLDLLPTHVWMNEDGSWFGVVSSWWSVVPEGWESAIEPLIAKQKEIGRARDKRLAQSLAHPAPAAGLAFTHARVLDVEHGRWLDDQTVVVVNGLIKSVGPAASARVPAGAETIDLGGKALLPGLWDMHSHLDEDSGALDIASGVTTARDVGNDPDDLDDWKARFDDGTAIGPHVLRMGFIEGRGPLAASSKITAENEAEARAAVDFYAKRHYEGIKIYNSVKPELVPILAKEAHARGMLVTGHIPVHMLANEAVRAGYDGIEHINMVLLNFFADHESDTRTPLRFTLVGDKAASFDLKSKPVTDFVALLKSHDTVITPTLDAFEYLLVSEQGKIIPGLEWMMARLPVQTQRQFLLGGLPLDGDKLKTYRASYEKCLEMVKLLHDAHVPEVAGTDSMAGVMLDHELQLFVRAGISPADTLKMDTIDAARAMKVDKKTGSIAPGKVADLVVVDGDPLAKISDVEKVVSTMRGGVLYASEPVFASVGVKPPH